LWLAAGLYAWRYLGSQPNAGRFAVWWLLTLTGSLGVFLAADLASFYLTFSLLSLAACGLVIHDGTPRALRAGTVYLVLAVVGEICLLMAFALLSAATPGATLAIRDAVALLPQSPWRGLTLALLVAGFGLKMGLVPLHVWLPLAHPAAPMPALAVLSGRSSRRA
jgi:formate hydrogenlyase subunit 3/multisubunit Na+/H+ antiporter MnhD subunit